MLSTSNQ